MGRRKQKKRLTTLAIFTTIAVFAWIGFSIYQVLRQSSTPQLLQNQLKLLKADFDKEVLESLKKRKLINPADLDRVPELSNIELLEKAKIKEETEVKSGETEENEGIIEEEAEAKIEFQQGEGEEETEEEGIAIEEEATSGGGLSGE